MRLSSTFLLMVLMSCSPIAGLPVSPPSMKGQQETVAYAAAAAAAHAGLQSQLAALNRGDLEAALRAYWEALHLLWASRLGMDRGYVLFAASIWKDFASPSAMGEYSADVLDVQGLGPETGLVVFRWQISRVGKRLTGGTSTQVWRRLDGTWKVVLEHAS